MNNSQNIEFSLRVINNVKRLVNKGLSQEAAQKAVFEELNAKFPHALASWLSSNA